jgi:uncharacterized membrane protein
MQKKEIQTEIFTLEQYQNQKAAQTILAKSIILSALSILAFPAYQVMVFHGDALIALVN